MIARIFISYDRSDVAFAKGLAAALQELGADVWVDVEDIPAGAKWSRAIQQGLDSAQLMLVVMSPESMDSSNVEDEWQYFLDHKKPVIPILLKPTKIHFQLNRIQYIDFHHQDWDSAMRHLHTELSQQGVTLKPLRTPIASATPPVIAPSATTFEAQPIVVPTGEPGSQVMRLVIGVAAILLIIAVIAGVLASGVFSDEENGTPTSENVGEIDPERGEALLAAMRDSNPDAAAEVTCPAFDAAADDFWGAGDMRIFQCEAGEAASQIDCNFRLEEIDYKRIFTLDENNRICTVAFNEVLDFHGNDSPMRGRALVRAVQFDNQAMISRLTCPDYQTVLENSPLRSQTLQNVFCHEGDSEEVMGCSFHVVSSGTTYYMTLHRDPDDDKLFCGDDGITDEQGNPLLD